MLDFAKGLLAAGWQPPGDGPDDEDPNEADMIEVDLDRLANEALDAALDQAVAGA